MYKIVFLLVIVFVQNGLAQNAFLERTFEQYPVDSVIVEFLKTKNPRKATYSDSTVRTKILRDKDFEKSVVLISILPYQDPDEKITYYKCVVDIEFYQNNDSLLYHNFDVLIRDSIGVDVPGKRCTITNDFFKKSYVIRGIEYYLDYRYVVGMKRSDKGRSLILRKEIKID